MYRVVVEASDDGFRIRSKEYEFTVSTKGKGISPPDTLLASLGSCIGVYINKYFEGSAIQCRDFSVTVEAEFSKESPICFKEIRAVVDLKDTRIDERRKNALLEFIKNCPVHNTLKASPEVEIKLI